MTTATKMMAMTMLALLLATDIALGHPQCLDFRPPFSEVTSLQLCDAYSDFGCCTSRDDLNLVATYNNLRHTLTSEDWTRCHGYIRDILCQSCSPYAAHIYDAERTMRARSFPGLCSNYCLSFVRDCRDVIPFLDPSFNGSRLLMHGHVFCQHVALTDVDYCYPDVLTNPWLNGELRQQKETKEGCLCLETMATNVTSPVLARHAGDGTGRLFVAQQPGVIKIMYPESKQMLRRPFLDISRKVKVSRRKGDERGLLGLAFHPRYISNGRFFLYYTTPVPADYVIPDRYLDAGIDDLDHLVRVSEMRVKDDDANRADGDSERVVLEIPQPYANHNGGEMLFGEDGYLYVFVGDGGAAGDPYNVAQNMNVLLGKVLRLDVDSNSDLPYAVPQDNPFVGQNGSRPEIFALGVRNIWRCGQDPGHRETGADRGRVLCGDVGQNAHEEVDVLKPGVNYGWPVKEGFSCYDDDVCHNATLEKEELPVHSYPHSVGKSVTGGHFYRGCESPTLDGLFIYGDYVSGRLFALEDDRGSWKNKDLTLCGDDVCFNGLTNNLDLHILSFGQDQDGEVYVLTTPSSRPKLADGKVFKLVDPLRRGNPKECSRANRQRRLQLSQGIYLSSNNETSQRPRIVDILVRRVCRVMPSFLCPALSGRENDDDEN